MPYGRFRRFREFAVTLSLAYSDRKFCRANLWVIVTSISGEEAELPGGVLPTSWRDKRQAEAARRIGRLISVEMYPVPVVDRLVSSWVETDENFLPKIKSTWDQQHFLGSKTLQKIPRGHLDGVDGVDDAVAWLGVFALVGAQTPSFHLIPWHLVVLRTWPRPKIFGGGLHQMMGQPSTRHGIITRTRRTLPRRLSWRVISSSFASLIATKHSGKLPAVLAYYLATIRWLAQA